MRFEVITLVPILAIAGIIFVVWVSIQEHREWEEFKVEHKCNIGFYIVPKLSPLGISTCLTLLSARRSYLISTSIFFNLKNKTR